MKTIKRECECDETRCRFCGTEIIEEPTFEIEDQYADGKTRISAPYHSECADASMSDEVPV